jgi:hypothetical protein
MKKISTILKASVAAIAVFLSSGANAQLDLKVNLLGVAFNDYGIYGEYSISENMSAQLGVMYNRTTVGVTSSAADLEEELVYSGVKVIPSFRFYFSPDDPTEGFFVEPYIRFRSQSSKGLSVTVPVDDNGNYEDEWSDGATYKDELIDYKTTRTKGGFGIAFGKKWVHDAGFVFETYAGFGKNTATNVKYSDDRVQDYYNDILTINNPINFHMRLGASIGWRF